MIAKTRKSMRLFTEALNKRSKNWVDVHLELYGENSRQAKFVKGFLKKVKVEYVCGWSPGAGYDSIAGGIHVTGQNFGFSCSLEQATCLQQMLSLACDQLREQLREMNKEGID